MDVDIDFADRDKILNKIKHVPASIERNGVWTKHNSGIYVTKIPENPIEGFASIDYKEAEGLGYFKIDFLNVSIYEQIRDEQHLIELQNKEPDWSLLDNRDFVSKIIHIGNHYDLIHKMPEPINSIPRMAMFLAVIRPAKRYLVGRTWKEVAKEVWEKDDSDVYSFKRSHSISYAFLVVIHMNLISE